MSPTDIHPRPRRQSARYAAAAVLALLTLASVVACSKGTEPQLAALKADPVTTMTLPNAKLLRKVDFAAGKTLGKPEYPQVNRAYAVEDPAAAPAVLAEAIKQATAAGWKLGSPTPRGAVGQKQIANCTADLSLELVPRSDPADSSKTVPGATLAVKLEYQQRVCSPVRKAH